MIVWSHLHILNFYCGSLTRFPVLSAPCAHRNHSYLSVSMCTCLDIVATGWDLAEVSSFPSELSCNHLLSDYILTEVSSLVATDLLSQLATLSWIGVLYVYTVYITLGRWRGRMGCGAFALYIAACNLCRHHAVPLLSLLWISAVWRPGLHRSTYLYWCVYVRMFQHVICLHVPHSVSNMYIPSMVGCMHLWTDACNNYTHLHILRLLYNCTVSACG